jgi:hypothetical protein
MRRTRRRKKGARMMALVVATLASIKASVDGTSGFGWKRTNSTGGLQSRVNKVRIKQLETLGFDWGAVQSRRKGKDDNSWRPRVSEAKEQKFDARFDLLRRIKVKSGKGDRCSKQGSLNLYRLSSQIAVHSLAPLSISLPRMLTGISVPLAARGIWVRIKSHVTST